MVERFDAGGLTLVAVDRRGTNTGALELLREPVGAMLGARENQHLAPLTLLDQVHEQVPLVLLLHAIGALLDELDGCVARRDLNRQRIVQQALGERPDIVGIGRGEQQILALGRQQLDDAPDVRNEAHVEHSIGLIEHQNLHLGQIHCALLGEIEQAARSRHQNIAAAAQRADLRIDVHAAEYLDDAKLEILAVVARAFRDLCGELAGGGEHERTRRGVAPSGGIGHEPLQNGQYKTCGFAGAGLRAGEHVATGENRGNGLHLDGRGRVVAFIGNSTQQFGQ